jgi:hypothetical protein
MVTILNITVDICQASELRVARGCNWEGLNFRFLQDLKSFVFLGVIFLCVKFIGVGRKSEFLDACSCSSCLDVLKILKFG